MPAVANTRVPGRTALQGWLAWVTATVGGASLGMVLGAIGGWLMMLPFLLVPPTPASTSLIPTIAQWLSSTVVLAFVAAGIATGQAIVLEVWLGRRIRTPWIVATTAAWLVGALVTGAIQNWLPGILAFLFLKLIFGAIVGAGQLAALRRELPVSSLWIAVSAVSLMVAESLSLTGMTLSILMVPASALIYGALSGPGIVWTVLGQLQAPGADLPVPTASTTFSATDLTT
ncbi:MAG: hypothetical protein IT306_24620 [Chloroflexi bacterium]|nr:hypothetical protein [Chloroflexota bacterium]